MTSDDPRGINQILPDENTWKIRQIQSNSLHDWAIVLSLDSTYYSFKPNVAQSSLLIEMDAYRVTTELDGFFVLSFGDQQYITFAVSFDGGFGANNGAYIYPNCGSSYIPSGNASTLISSIPPPLDQLSLRNGLTENNWGNLNKLTSIANGNNFPITFELINDNINNTFTFIFSSPKFDGTTREPLQCMYNSTFGIGHDFKLYFTPDADQNTDIEEIRIRSFTVTTMNVTNSPGITESIKSIECYMTSDVQQMVEQCIQIQLEPSISPSSSPSVEPTMEPTGITLLYLLKSFLSPIQRIFALLPALQVLCCLFPLPQLLLIKQYVQNLIRTTISITYTPIINCVYHNRLVFQSRCKSNINQ